MRGGNSCPFGQLHKYLGKQSLVYFHVFLLHPIPDCSASPSWQCSSIQFQSQDYSVLSAARSHLSSMLLVRSLYKTAKAQLAKTVTSDCETHLNHLSVQCKFLDSA